MPRLGLIGPWAHIYPHDGVPGPAIDFLGEAIRWWDHWLKGHDTGIMGEPMLRAFIEHWQPPPRSRVESAGRFVGETVWPSPAIRDRSFHLAQGKLGVEPSEGETLSIQSPLWTGTCGGEWMGTGVAGEAPIDQRWDDAHSLVFDSEALSDPLEILGNPAVDLLLACDKPLGQLAVRLCDVAPDGTSARISYGVLNLSHRDASAEPSLMTPGASTQIHVSMKVCGYRFSAGHRIRLALSTSYWPLLWPARDFATMTLWTDGSRMTLPVRSGGDILTLPPPQHGPRAPATKLDPGHVTRAASFDLIAGTATYTTVGQGGLFGEGVLRWDDTGTSLSHDLERCLTIVATDPLSATATIRQTYRMQGEGYSVRIESVTGLQGDRDAFTLSGTISVFERDDLVHAREWVERFPRDHM